MVLLLEIAETFMSYHLLPLQFGEVDTFFVVLVAIGFAIVVIAVIIFALRRTAALSDEFSKEAKAKFDAIKPTGTIRKEEPPTPKPRVSTLALEGRAPEAGLTAVRTELQDTKTRLQQYVRDVLREREATRNEIEAIRTEIRTLREKLLASTLEIQKLRGSLEEQNAKLQSQKREMETQRQQVRETVEPPAQVQPESREKGVSRSIFDVFRRRPCPYCGRQLDPQATYCDACGQRVATTIPGR